jgi:hypothetical protein
LAAAEAIADPAVEQRQHLEGTGPLNNRAAGEETIDLEGIETGGADNDVESNSGDLETAECIDIWPQHAKAWFDQVKKEIDRAVNLVGRGRTAKSSRAHSLKNIFNSSIRQMIPNLISTTHYWECTITRYHC